MTLTVVNNLGSSAENYTVLMTAVGFPKGVKVVDVLNCRTAVVDSNGALEVLVAGGLPVVSQKKLSFLFTFIILEWNFTET